MAAEADKAASSPEMIWLRKKVDDALRGSINKDKFVKAFETEEISAAISEFFKQSDCRTISFYPGASEPVKASISAPEGFKKKALLIMKTKEMQVTAGNYGDLVCMEYTPNPLENMSYVIQDVMQPLISNPINRLNWTEPAAKEILSKMSTFSSQLYVTLGQSKGKTLLAFPPDSIYSTESV